MERAEWERLKVVGPSPVLLTVAKTSIASVAEDASVLATVAKRDTATRVRISIYRNDPNDDPTPINVDEYSVLGTFPSNIDVGRTIEQATTDADPNFFRYHDDHVFFVKECTDKHWLAQLPEEVLMLLEGA